MELLLSNFPPLRTKAATFSEMFYSLLPKTTRLDIAVGYITADSLIELKKAIEFNNISQMNLTIGMHYLEKFTELEYQSAIDLNDYLISNKLGQVRLVTSFRYHGKLYSYQDDAGAFVGIIGSNNLSGIIENNVRVYEASVLIDDRTYASQIQDFIQELNRTSTVCIEELDIQEFNVQNTLLENHEYVEQLNGLKLEKHLSELTDISFDIPIKSDEAPQSNLNVFFGKGREGKNGLVKPRHWYEVELIVPKMVTSQPFYPQSKTDEAIFDVITDDGWKFKCKVSGDYSKNLRSENDLKIMGKWLKGRLENKGVLRVGQLVTKDTLKKYGRDTFTLTKTQTPNLWFLDFGVK
ncbi:restriction endonuclease PLD domain-containing protein [Paenibacillus crassostreae]|uniref:NgoFVII family restriction endonuclease n=1 Tax=Paenibacillus crassostreae TaxID=1763538 RepID=A0A167AQ21_9BACL|nr:restriction endonuclease PLD domain-containing protein [Paenibacillus crassostreae]AOZ93765.1 hypothetical protein LPB68_17245 [Paenibacillus crassostreae]OAB71299.1 hypothetical protein PNBC_20115 [Paenibacillus crassostreae]